MDLIKKKDGFRDERHIIFPADTQQTLLQHPLIAGTYLAEIGYYPNAKYHYRERIHGSEEYILIYCLEGAGTIEIADQQIKLTRGEIFCIPRNRAHRYYSDEQKPWSILWLHFHTQQAEAFHLAEEKIQVIKDKKRYALLQNHFIDLFNFGEKAQAAEIVICTAQLLRLILTEIYHLKDNTTMDQQNTYLTKCIKYMDDHIEQELPLNELADHAEISASYLSSLFKRYTNKSPIEYFIEMRVEQACRYLKLSDLKIYQIAAKVGYQDPYYFSRIFKKNTGYSPKDYRNKFSQNIHEALKS